MLVTARTGGDNMDGIIGVIISLISGAVGGILMMIVGFIEQAVAK